MADDARHISQQQFANNILFTGPTAYTTEELTTLFQQSAPWISRNWTDYNPYGRTTLPMSNVANWKFKQYLYWYNRVLTSVLGAKVKMCPDERYRLCSNAHIKYHLYDIEIVPREP